MSEFHEIIDGLTPYEGGYATNPGEDWRQGRTLFGGLSAALCYAACERAAPGLPPLRSAQIAYIGPSAGEATLRPQVLRQGKSATFMACDLIADGAVATRALFVFGGNRESALSANAPPAPDLARPDDCQPLFGRGGPVFAGHFDQRRASPDALGSGADKGDLMVWVRHRDPTPPPGLVSLVALGDALPPASMPRLTAPAAISTISWQFDLCAPEAFDANGWHLLRSTDDAVGNGYAGQAMAMWDEGGRPVLLARQSVALFA